ncbi:unnamed protein product [Calypogeia fissa]
MSGTVWYFWLHFVAQARHLLDALSQVDIPAFSKGAGIIDRVEQLYNHHTDKGERDPEYQPGLEQAYIADLFYSSKDKSLSVEETAQYLQATRNANADAGHCLGHGSQREGPPQDGRHSSPKVF